MSDAFDFLASLDEEADKKLRLMDSVWENLLAAGYSASSIQLGLDAMREAQYRTLEAEQAELGIEASRADFDRRVNATYEAMDVTEQRIKQ